MARTLPVLALALVLAVAVFAQPVPPASKCGSNTGVGISGGWSTVGSASDIPSDVYTAIAIDLIDSGAGGWEGCDAPETTLKAACSQVVAGQNFQVVADLTCNDTLSTVSVDATVYVPLPYMNSFPNVTSLTVLSG